MTYDLRVRAKETLEQNGISLARARLDILYYLLHIIIPEAVYTIVIAFVFYPLLLLINRRLERSERKSEDQIAQKD